MWRQYISLSFEELNILGNITNDSYGRGSTDSYDYKPRLGGGVRVSDSSVVVKSSIDGDIMHVTALTIINLGHIGMQHQEIAKCENELNQHIKNYLSNVKKEFKKKENAGRALKAKQVKDSEITDIDMINHYAATRQAYVKRTICFEIG